MKRELGDGFELDDDRDHTDVAAVNRYLSEESYWAEGRELAEQEALVREAARVVGLFHDGDQIGFCRAVRMSPTLIYLADVYVLEQFRGRGLGVELVSEMIERGPYAACKWELHTSDAHAMYERFGFEQPTGEALRKLMQRPAAE